MIKTTGPKHVVVCGFSRSGTTMLYNMLRASAVAAEVPPHEMSALKASPYRERDLITKRPLDVLSLDRIAGRAEEIDTRIVFVVRDCRALMTSTHSAAPTQFFQGFDQCFLIGPDWCSYSNPGILEIHEAISAFTASSRLAWTVVRYEDLVRDPEAVRGHVEQFTGVPLPRPFSTFHSEEVPERLTVQLNGLRAPETSRIAAWRDPAKLARVVRQFALEPRLQEVLQAWGYETDLAWLDAARVGVGRSGAVRRGSIVTIAGGDVEAPSSLRSAASLGLSAGRISISKLDEQRNDALGTVSALLRRRRDGGGALLFVDGAAKVRRDPWPYLSQYDGDAAFYTNQAGDPRSEVVWLNDTAGAGVFLNAWLTALLSNPTAPLGAPLRAIMSDYRQGAPLPFRLQHLPPALCYGLPASPAATFWSVPLIEFGVQA